MTGPEREMINHVPTIEVPAHDLHRLLLAFRAAIESGAKPDGWAHAADWDWSFERLSDILDAQRIASGHQADPRTRCQHTSAYTWPPVNGPAQWICIRASKGSAERHLVIEDARRHPLGRAVCGFRFADEDIVKRPRAAYRPCGLCEREQRLQGIEVQVSVLGGPT